MSTKFEKSSGNVFADIGIPNPEQALAKAQIAARICTIIEDRKLTQTQAAKILKIPQPKVSALMRGQLGGFSSERLFKLLNVLGQDVVITVRPHRKTAENGTVQVVLA
jgi:predicted XRE-type DNA-binding protein